MTIWEKGIWFLAGAVVIGSLAYHLVFRNWEQLQGSLQSAARLQEARRLLGAGANIQAREQAVARRLKQLRDGYYQGKERNDAEMKLLDLVEGLALKSGLDVQLKNTTVYSREELGVSIEGKTGAAELVRFLHQLATAPMVLKVKRLQLHNVAESKALDYQIAISAWIVD